MQASCFRSGALRAQQRPLSGQASVSGLCKKIPSSWRPCSRPQLPANNKPETGSFGRVQTLRQRQVAAAASSAAVAEVGTAAAASFPALQNALAPLLPYMMAAAAACCAVLALLMAVAPGAAVTQRSVRSNLPLVLLAAAYGLVLLASWSPDTLHLMMPGSLEEGLKGGFNPQFFPTLESVQTLFSRPFTAASFLLHVLGINLIAARSAFVDGVSSRVPTLHSVLLSAVVGPLGLLSHELTKAIYALLAAVTGQDLRPAAKPKLERSGQGTITIMPYDK